MRSRQSTLQWLACLLLLLVAHGNAPAQGYPTSRAGRFETYLGGQYQSGVSSLLRGQPVEIAFRNTGLLATGIGYHFHDHLAVSLNMAFGTTTMTLDGPDPDDTVKQDAYLFNGSVNLDYNILKGPVTPFITGGVGWNLYESRVPGSSPEYICTPGYYSWWCGYQYPTRTRAAFAGNVGVGFRWDLNENLFIKGMATTTYSKLNDAERWFQYIQGTLVFGWSY